MRMLPQPYVEIEHVERSEGSQIIYGYLSGCGKKKTWFECHYHDFGAIYFDEPICFIIPEFQRLFFKKIKAKADNIR